MFYVVQYFNSKFFLQKCDGGKPFKTIQKGTANCSYNMSKE